MIVRNLALSLLLALPMGVQAQPYPSKPIRLVVPWPPGTPAEVVERLSVELNKALADPAVRERLATLALEPQPMSPAAFATVLATESNRWMSLGRAAKIKAD